MKTKIETADAPKASGPYCKMAKELLKELKVPFQEFNVGVDHEKAEEMIQKSGQNGVPVLDINGKILVGFNELAIKKALK